MSSLTTIRSTSMEEQLEHLDTRLSLGIVVAGSCSTPVQLDDQLFPPLQQLLLSNDQEPRTTKQHKRARTAHGDRDDGGDARDARKKLRLTVEQAALLEDTFRAHNILSHAQKHDLAQQLGLSPRQVEVWFQNRRARTKQKQTEVDCELLRRWCQRLTDENSRLRHQLAETRSSAVSIVNVFCASCGKLAAPVDGRKTET